MTERRNPWERLDDESDQAWEAFKTYRDMGTGRSIRKVAARLDKSVALMSRWSSRHRWAIRAAEWDREDDRLFLREQRYARKEIARKQQKLASSFQSKLMTRLMGLDVDEMSPGDMIRWLEITTKVEAQAAQADLDTNAYILAQAQAKDAGQGLDGLTDEQRVERMEALQREMAARLAARQEERDAVHAMSGGSYLEEDAEKRQGGNYSVDHRGES